MSCFARAGPVNQADLFHDLARRGHKRRRQMRMNRLIFSALLALFIIAPASHAQTTTFPVGLGPEGVTTDGANVFVANQFSDTVTKLRASDGGRAGTFSVGHCPVGLAFDGAN